MPTIFCCDAIEPYRPQYLDHQSKFNNFMSWGSFPRESTLDEVKHDPSQLSPSYAVQLVRQVNFGPLESKRYFIPENASEGQYVEVSERDLIQANFKKANTYKNYKCRGHNKFFEVNIYQKDPVNKHHWRANIARPAGSIDL
ncbi:major facilitator superfamily transporter [Fusarium pseudocircinatum]|uniref:Major facilitator superfamily transporter n=1 Tax=Fusarium pseudocircinatum TaxID=56676 RepID=A0A8H5UUU7_9HYPO|nr:major facilitator superfamily transporter [Fusarium pseudocircinatum]